MAPERWLKGGIDLCMSGCLHAAKWSVWWPGCLLGFLGRQCQVAPGGKRQNLTFTQFSAPISLLQTLPQCPPLTPVKAAGSSRRGLGWKGGLKSRQRKLVPPSPPLWSCYSPRDLPFRCPMTGSGCPTNPCYMRAWGLEGRDSASWSWGPTGGVAVIPTSE